VSTATEVRTPPHHDTLTCYTDYQCRLPECVARVRAYEKRRRHSKAAGTWQPLVDATPVREHLLELHAAGVTVYRVATLTGLSDNVIRGFTQTTRAGQRINGRRHRTTPAIANKILAIDVQTAAPAKVNAIGSLRRLQALVALGWPLQEVARRTGISDQTMYNIARQPLILATTAAKVTAAYEQLKNTRASRSTTISAQQRNTARNRAASHRWPPPKYWDEVGAIDDPDFQPQYGISRLEVVAQDAWWLLRSGLNSQQIATRLGISRDYVEKALREVPEEQVAA
jgi:transposase